MVRVGSPVLCVRWLFVLWLMLSCPLGALAQDEYYYYDPDGVGAHAFYNPQNFVVQGGLGALYEERIDTFEWSGGLSTVNESLIHPIDAIEAYGWGRFFYREFVPHLGPGQNYVPNWVWHFTGGGMRTKLMQEYYSHLGFEYWQSQALSWLTMYSYHYLNETVQAARFTGRRRASVDPLADMYFFDWAGGLLFQFDAVNRYMSRRLHMREWSFQAQLNPFTLRLLNNGQLYWLRRELYGPVSLSFLTGEQITSLNLTIGWGRGRQLSLGVGPKSKAFVAQKNGDTDPSRIVFSWGIFYSIDDNPFITFTFEPRGGGRGAGDGLAPSEKCMFNVYPGLLDLFGFPLGMSLIYQRDTVFFGLSAGPSPAGVVLAAPHGHEVLNGAVNVVTGGPPY